MRMYESLRIDIGIRMFHPTHIDVAPICTVLYKKVSFSVGLLTMQRRVVERLTLQEHFMATVMMTPIFLKTRKPRTVSIKLFTE